MRLYKLLLIVIMSLPLSLFSQISEGIVGEVGLFKLEGDRFFSLPTKMPVKMENGDSFQVYLKTESSVYTYVVYESAAKDVMVLNSSFMTNGDSLFLPSEDELYTLEPPKGIEKIHIIISVKPEKALDNLIAEHNEESNRGRDILNELVRLRKSISEIGLAPEKPAPMGGVYRSVTKGDQELETTDIFAGSLYVKTIRIRH